MIDPDEYCEHVYEVVHPLFDVPELKRNADHLGPMKLGWGSKLALLAIRIYLVTIIIMGVYRVIIALWSHH